MRPHVLGLAAALVLPLAMQPLAIDSADAQQARMRFAGMDSNGDGRITRDEWRGSLQSFRVHDWNDDGVLSGDEVRAGGRRGAREEDFREGRQELRDWTAERFATLDHDRDGRISRNEWHYDFEAFRRADRNRDNVLSRQEFLGEENFDDDREDRFVDLDLNGNGRIERGEWHGSREGFEWLDKNSDGTLTWDEVVPEEQSSNDMFTSLDIDRNGRIDRDEWHWSRASFNQRDRNRDGVITRNEMPAAAEGQPVGTSGHTIVVDATQRWTDTGILVRTGDLLTFRAEGTIQMSGNPSDVAEPHGSRSGRRAPHAPVSSEPAGGLIAMISGSQPVYVGNRSTPIRVPANGRLYLSVNDDHLADNSGEFRVTINIQQR